MTAQSGQRFVVLCEGHSPHIGQRKHVEYRFRVRHCGGCEWTVQRRYMDLLSLHESLCAVFGQQCLPAFPPKQLVAGGVMSALLGGNTNSEVAQERVAAFQDYFDVLCEQQDVVRTHIFQAALAVYRPEPVAHLRVKGWLPANAKGERALLDIRAESQETESSAVVESYHVVARVKQTVEDTTSSNGELRIADVQIPASAVSSGSGAVIEGLPAASQVELEVCAENALGRSAPVSIVFKTQTSQSSTSPSSNGYATEARPPTMSSSSSTSPVAETSSTQDAENCLEKRRLELEEWWSKKREEAEREDAERQRQMAELRIQSEALEREKEELMMERQLSGASSPTGYCSPSMSSPIVQSPSASPRSSRVIDHSVEVKMLTEAAAEAVGLAAGEAARAQWKDLRARQEEVMRQSEELQRQRQEHRIEVDRAAAEVQAEREATMKRSEEEQRHAREELQRERQELEALLSAQKEAVAAREAEYATRAEALEEQQELLTRQRLEVESNRAAEEEGRLQQLEELRSQQEALEQRKAHVEEEHSAEEQHRRTQAEELKRQQEELYRKANFLAKTEDVLGAERMELRRSRASLAMVQAHVASMLDKAQGGETKLHSLDGSDELANGQAEQLELVVHGCDEIDEDEEAEVTDSFRNAADADEEIWSMDWTSPVLVATHKNQHDR